MAKPKPPGLYDEVERLRAAYAKGRREGIEDVAKWLESDSGTWVAERLRRALQQPPERGEDGK